MKPQTPGAEFATAADRIETFLRDRKPRLAAGPAALVEALAAAAAAFGTTMPSGLQVNDGETAVAALERLAAASGLLVRPVSLATAGSGDTAAPIVAFEAAGGAPVLIGRRGRRWSVATQQLDWIAKPAPTLDVGKFDATGYMILPAFPDGPIGLRQLFGFTARRNVKELAGLLLVTMAAGVIAAIMPLVSAPLLEIVVPARDMWLLGEIAVFLGAVVAADLMTRALVGLIRVRLEGRSGLMLRAAAIDRALRIADRLAETGQAPPAAPLAALSARCVETWHRGAWGLGLTLATSLLLALPSIIVMAHASLRGAMIVALVFLAVFGLAAWTARWRIEALTKGLATPQSWMATAYEGLAMIDTIRAGAAEGRLFSRWADGFLALRHRFLRADRIGAGAAAIERGSESLLVLAAMLALALTGSVVTGLVTVTFVIAVGNVTGAAAALLGALDQVAMLALQYRMIEPMLRGEPRPRSRQPSAAVPAGRIELEHVDCRLDARGPRVLTDISLTIEPGEHIGIAGPSGAGKSTLLRVILGLVQPEAGHVLIDGRDLAGLDAAAMRRRIGVVGQGARLFPGTLFDNFAAGAPLTTDMAMAAARLAGIEAEILALPLGLATPIGDTDCGFSGGQVQRILLARALASKPKLLVLDEATSALDPERQAHVDAAIAALRATTISVAHRLDTLKACDRIYVLNEGRIVEAGTFDALVAAGGLFADLRKAETAATCAAGGNAVHAAFGAVEAAFA